MAQPASTDSTSPADAMCESAQALISTLRPDQCESMGFELGDEDTRRDWGYFPRAFHGLALGVLDPDQQKLVHRLVASALSLHAYTKVAAIIALDNVLDVLEAHAHPEIRDPSLYYLSIFGAPGDAVWAWQFEGHHVCLNVTIVDGEVVSSTPLFLGSNPAEIRHGGRHILRLLGEEQEAALELLGSLDNEQRRRAVIATIPPPDFVLMNAPRVPRRMEPGGAGGPSATMGSFDKYPRDQGKLVTYERDMPKGISWADLRPAQQERFRDLVDVYVEHLPESVASIQRTRLQSAGLDSLHFAWAGDPLAGHPQYYRVQGPSLLIEYDNTQNDANHIHAVWRDPTNDFGDDALRDHLYAQHG